MDVRAFQIHKSQTMKQNEFKIKYFPHARACARRRTHIHTRSEMSIVL